MWTSSNEICAKKIKTKNGFIHVVIGSFSNDTPSLINGRYYKKYWLWRIEYIRDGFSGKFFPDAYNAFSNKKDAIDAAMIVAGDLV